MAKYTGKAKFSTHGSSCHKKHAKMKYYSPSILYSNNSSVINYFEKYLTLKVKIRWSINHKLKALHFGVTKLKVDMTKKLFCLYSLSL